MKYTPKQAKILKEKGMNRFTKYNSIFLRNITIKEGFYIIESKMNIIKK